MAIRYAHRDTVSYPIAHVQVQVEGHRLEVEATIGIEYSSQCQRYWTQCA